MRVAMGADLRKHVAKTLTMLQQIAQRATHRISLRLAQPHPEITAAQRSGRKRYQFHHLPVARLRMAGRTPDRRAAHALGFEVRSMHMHGPGGAGGACEPRVRDVLAVKSGLLPRRFVNAQIAVEGR